MGVAITLQQYLDDQGIDYHTLVHQRTATASESAEAAHVPGGQLVKAVILKDDTGYLMAALPASHHIRFGELQQILKRRVGLATEQEIATLFADCDEGAVPPIGMAYGLEMVVDDDLLDADDLYFEGGDHATLVHVQADAFERMTGAAPHGHFSRHD